VLLFSALASSILVTIEVGDRVLINATGTTAGAIYVLKLADDVLEWLELGECVLSNLQRIDLKRIPAVLGT